MNGEVTQGRLSAILVGEEADHGVSYMRRLSPFLALAAASLAFGALASDAFAAPRGGHGFRGGGRIAALGHRHHVYRHAGLNRFHHHGGFGHLGRFGFHRGLGLGGLWDGPWSGDGYGGATNVAFQHNVANAGGGYGYPSLLDLPASTGIRSEPAGQPVIYVIRSTPRLSRRGQQGHARFAAQAAQPGSGPRIIEVTAPRGL